jgi:hypothetical protein
MSDEMRRFHRTVEPFEDVEIEVDLQDMLTCGLAPAPYCDVYPLADWIEDGWVQLRVVSPRHVALPSDISFFEAPELLECMSGGHAHRLLCALAAAYLTSIGKKARIGGASSCSYAGGWADVISVDGSMYVECGTLNTRKPIEAMLAGETLMVLPYALGCDRFDENTVARLDPFPERVEEDSIAKYLRLGRIQLGYIFEPKCRLKPNPLKPPLGLRPLGRTVP